MYSGYGDVKTTRQFVSLYEKPFIAVNSTSFDGK
jgi:hypothetical protein